LPENVVTFGFEHGKFQAKNLRSEGLNTKFSLVDSETKTLQEIELSIPGEHNVLNAMSVIAVMKHLGISFSPMLSGLKRFTGTKRRFQIIGETSGVLIVDDYAHHPSEISATLTAARQGFNPTKLWAIFQPHRFTRTYFFEQGFAESLQLADEVIVTDVYAASEAPIEGVTGENITRRITDKPVHYFPKKDEIGLYLSKILKPGEMAVFMGAGDIYAVAKDLHHRLVQKSFAQIQSLDHRAGQDTDVSNKIA
jgi:UDP-N-acetylmuramate--alanine ligase